MNMNMQLSNVGRAAILLTFLLLYALLLHPAVLTIQHVGQTAIGFEPGKPTATAILTNAAGSSVLGAFSFIAPVSPFSGTMRLQDFRVYVSAVSGTTPKVTAALYSDNAGVPGALVETGSASGTLSATSWNTFSGFTATSNLTSGTQYWVVLTCTTGTSVTITYISNLTSAYGFPPISGGTAGTGVSWGATYEQSADNGGTWTSVSSPGIIGYRIGFTDGTDSAYAGAPISGYTQANAATEKLYTNSGSVQKFGTYFTTPANAILNIKAVVMFVRNTSASGNLQMALYSGASPTLLASASVVPVGNILASGGGLYRASFPNTVVVQPSTILSVAASNTAADDSTHYLSVYKYTIDTDANSLSLFPFGGMQSIKYTGGAWGSPVNSEIVPFWLLLDSSGEFGAVSSVQHGAISQ